MEWAVKKGARGVRIMPGYHCYSLLIPGMSKLLNRLNELRLPLQVCARLEDERLQHPRFTAKTPPFYEFAETIRECGNLPLIISGLRAREWQNVKELFNADQQTDHILLDLWFTNGPLQSIAALCRRGETEMFAYSSCTPLQTAEATMLQIAAADIGEDERGALCRNNALRILQLETMQGT